jgi:hypothetical protein
LFFVFVIIILISHVSVVCPIPPFTYLARMRNTVESMIMGYIPTTCYFNCYDYKCVYDIPNQFPRGSKYRPKIYSLAGLMGDVLEYV